MLKRGQFTVFVVLGIVLITIFAFLLYARGLIVNDSLELEARNAVKDALQSENINVYVKSCLNRVTDESLILSSIQGGRIYEFQGGSYPDPVTSGSDYITFNVSDIHSDIEYGLKNISYGLKQNTNQSCVVIAAPDYPIANTSLDNLISKYHLSSINSRGCSFDSGAIGIFSLSKLCDSNGTNKINVTGELNFFQYKTCKGLAYGNNSIQEQLQTYISNKMIECIDPSIFENIGYNMTLDNNPETILTYGENGFTVEIVYPFTVRYKGRDVKTSGRFQVHKDVKLKELYEYIYGLLEKEYKNIYFSIAEDYQQVVGWNNNIEVLRITNPCMNCVGAEHDDVFMIIDNSSEIQGKPLIFVFGVQNRAPVLDFISSGQRYNLVVMEGETIDLVPFGIDPDENFIRYEYNGWREDYISLFNPAACINDLANCLANSDRAPFSMKIYNDPLNWSSSEEYIDSEKNASYRTTWQDIGLHHTIISIMDEEGKTDFQNISIAVIDEPDIIPNIEAPFPELGMNASIEDPITFNALYESLLGIIPFEFFWNDLSESFNIETSDPVLLLPSNQNIQTINSEYFRDTGLHTITIAGKYEHPGTGQDVWTAPNFISIEVHECLPHKNVSNKIFPYNTLGQNSFGADHTCCGDGTNGFDWGNYTENNPCYERIEYGANISFDDLNEFFGTPQIIPDNANSNNFNGFDENDILIRNIERVCDGTRGNICSGDMEETILIQDNCNQFTRAGDDERCEGPQSVNPVTNPAGCYQYTPGNSFEKRFASFGFNGDGICNENSEQSSIGSNGYGNNGPYSCKATCSGGTCSNTRLLDCECNLGNACDGLSAENTWPNGVCSDNNFCTSSCIFQTPEDSAAACECDTGNSNLFLNDNGGNNCCQAGEIFDSNIDGSNSCCSGAILSDDSFCSSNNRWVVNGIFCNEEVSDNVGPIGGAGLTCGCNIDNIQCDSTDAGPEINGYCQEGNCCQEVIGVAFPIGHTCALDSNCASNNCNNCICALVV